MCSQWQYPFSKATVSQCSFWNQGEKCGGKYQRMKKKTPPLFSIFQVTELCSAICRAWLNDVGDWRLCQGDVVPQSKKTGAALTFRAQSKPFLLWFPIERMCLFISFSMKRAVLMSLLHARYRGVVLIRVCHAVGTCVFSSGTDSSCVMEFVWCSEKSWDRKTGSQSDLALSQSS